jgi:YihY family inner membrane protein
MFEPVPESPVARALRPTLRYMMQTEVHVYAFAVAASVLLSFAPFLIVILSLCRNVLKWRAAVDAIHLALSDYFPGPLADFVQRNVDIAVERGALQLTSIVLLLVVANGVFEPLEVALNRAWGISKNRSYWRNQLISLGLILTCGVLALLSAMFTALNYSISPRLLGARSPLVETLGLIFFKMAAIPLSMLMLFLIYWLLPNRKIPAGRVVPVAIVVGLGLEALKYFNLLTWPMLQAKLTREYGPFVYSVSIILWSFLAAMVVLAGAEWSARPEAGEQLHVGAEIDRL